ncbi:MAG: VTT domain-containing protein [Candidatus Pacebacteria bacterium]|nr:VTT domain-containing protein [Candidatus Paceibacterota bacterium]
MSLDFIISNFSYIGIFLLMVANGIVNFPSSQILYVIVGYFVSTDSLSFSASVLAGGLGNAIGNIITFLLIKKYEKPLAQKLLMLPKETFDKMHTALHATFKERGMWWIFLGKLIPSIKAFIPVIAGLSQLKTLTTSIIFIVASLIWATGIISIGYFFGKTASLSYLPIVSLAIAVIVIAILYKKFSKEFSK